MYNIKENVQWLWRLWHCSRPVLVLFICYPLMLMLCFNFSLRSERNSQNKSHTKIISTKITICPLVWWFSLDKHTECKVNENPTAIFTWKPPLSLHEHDNHLKQYFLTEMVLTFMLIAYGFFSLSRNVARK